MHSARLTLALAPAFLFGLAAGSARGVERANDASLRALQRIERGSPAAWKTRWDETGTPHTIYGSRSIPLNLRTQDAAGAVRGFLREHADLFRMRPGLDYRVDRKSTRLNSSHLGI